MKIILALAAVLVLIACGSRVTSSPVAAPRYATAAADQDDRLGGLVTVVPGGASATAATAGTASGQEFTCDPVLVGSAGGSLGDPRRWVIVQTSPGHCKEVEDVKGEAALAAADDARRTLWDALRARVLTADELRAVAQYGPALNVDDGVSYQADEKGADLTHALQIQAILQARAQAAKPCAAPPEGAAHPDLSGSGCHNCRPVPGQPNILTCDCDAVAARGGR